MASIESFLAVASAGGAGWWMYRKIQADKPPPLQPRIGGLLGWYGDPVEVARVQEPVFEDSDAGKIGYVAYLLNALQDIGLTHGQALLFLAHMTREGGWGKAVWNYNFGNIKTGSTIKGPWFWLTDKEGAAKYRAYRSAADGIYDNVELVRKLSRYKKAWQMLLAEDPNWYGELGLSGYYGHYDHAHPEAIAPVQREYNDILQSVARRDQAQASSTTPPQMPAPAAPSGPQSLDSGDWTRVGVSALLAGTAAYAVASILAGAAAPPPAPSPPVNRRRRPRRMDASTAT